MAASLRFVNNVKFVFIGDVEVWTFVMFVLVFRFGVFLRNFKSLLRICYGRGFYFELIFIFRIKFFIEWLVRLEVL